MPWHLYNGNVKEDFREGQLQGKLITLIYHRLSCETTCNKLHSPLGE